MVERMSQEQIDALLEEVNKTETENKLEEIAEATGGTKQGRLFKRAKKKELRFPNMYRSPIIKEENIIYNPQPKEVIPKNKIVVISLNYLKEKYSTKSTFS